MKPKYDLFCEKVRWQGREAYSLGNGLIQLVILTGGGHVAEFHFVKATGFTTLNPLWVPTWKTIEPYRYREHLHAVQYGPITEGKLLSGLVGHNICLDYFGSPSPEEARCGLSQHGEAAIARWRKTKVLVSSRSVVLRLSVRLPVAGILFSREIEICGGESVVYFAETVINEKKCDHFFHWTQHVTIGPPFLSHEDTVVDIPAGKGVTFPHEYDEGRSLLGPGKRFHWPAAPAAQKRKTYDLSHTLLNRGLGFVAAVLIDTGRSLGFVALLNRHHRLLLGYCFNREDFPWVTLWEENRAIRAVPWKGRTEARGLEFGTTPLPIGRREAQTNCMLFGTPTFTTIPAGGRRTSRYIAFLAHVPDNFNRVEDVRTTKGEILVSSGKTSGFVRLHASRVPSFGSP